MLSGLKIAIRDVALALMVLGVVFLNFGHLPASAQPGWQAGAHDSWCGAPVAPDTAGHAPCHACRFDVAALPPAPGLADEVTFVALAVDYAVPAHSPALTGGAAAAWPRGPPGN